MDWLAEAEKMVQERYDLIREAGVVLLSVQPTSGFDAYLKNTKKWRTEITVLHDLMERMREDGN